MIDIFNIVVSGHGNFADGIKASFEFILGENQNIEYINFNNKMNSENLLELFEKAINKDDKVNDTLFLTDLVGGSPFNISATLTQKYPNVKVIGGMNLPLLIEAYQNSENNTLSECFEIIISCGIQSIQTLEINKKIIQNTDCGGI